MTRDKILAALPNLKKADLQAIQAAATALLGSSTKTPDKPANEPVGWLFEALVACMGLKLAYGTFQASGPGKHFTKNAPTVIEFMQGAFPQAMQRRVAALAIMKLGIDLLKADLKRKKAPVTLGTVVVNLPRLGEVFSDAFPQYIECGMSEAITTAMIRKN